MCAKAYMWRMEGNVQASDLCFCSADSRPQTWVVKLGGKYPYPLNHVARQRITF